jgi:hypothetical protein
MSASSTPAWLPSVVPAPRPRHRAPGADAPGEGAEAGAVSEWSRELFDPARDEDPFDWLGFAEA